MKSRKIIFNRHQILQCYMIMGGIPYYWSLLKKGKSLPQNIDDLFLYRLIIYPVKSVNGEYRRIGGNKNIYQSVSGSMEKIIHFEDLLAILNSLHILPLYVDRDYFKVLTEGFLGCGKPILFTLKKEKGRVLKKN